MLRSNKKRETFKCLSVLLLYMDKERLQRYKNKLELIEHRTGELEEWSQTMLENEKDKLASYKAFQEIAEAVNDSIAMMLKDNRLLPTEDYPNIDKAVTAHLIPENVKKPLQEMTGLRNRIVHEYNGLNDRTAKESMETLLSAIQLFVASLRQWLKKQ